MKILLSEKLRRLRKNADLTQEQFACAIGVSPQSVSKWERDEGYPDISLLPAIANYFKITIDELLGNDKEGVDEDMNAFYQKYWNELQTWEERTPFVLEYYRKYPKNYRLADLFCFTVNNDRAHLEEYFPSVREACERIINECTEQEYRDAAMMNMCMMCPDKELDKWLDMCPISYGTHREETREARLWAQSKLDESRFVHDVNNLRIFLHFMVRHPRTWCNAYKTAAWHKYKIKLIESFAEDGVIPKAWLGAYAKTHFFAAFGLTGYGDFEQAYRYLDRALDIYEEWLAIPDDEMLDFGDNFIFGGIRMQKKNFKEGPPVVISPTDERIEIEDLYELNLDGGLFYYGMSTVHGWAYFNPARDTEEFKAFVERAKKIAEKYDPSVFEEE